MHGRAMHAAAAREAGALGIDSSLADRTASPKAQCVGRNEYGGASVGELSAS